MSLSLRAVALAAVLLAPVALTGCGSTGAEGDSGSGPVSVVATTNVWGSIAERVGGDSVEVTSIVTDPSQDPHSYQASTQTLLTVSRAGLLVENGGGYDDFLDQMVSSSSTDAPVLNAVEVSGKDAQGLNEHLWYDLPTARRMADAIAEELGRLRPEQARTFERNAASLDADIEKIEADVKALREDYAGKPIGITEPLPLQLTEAIGLVDRTPAEFSQAIEEGADVSPAVLKETLDLYTGKQVVALVYNAQTTGALTDRVREAAAQAGLPVVPVTETLPGDLGYVSWMQRNVAALSDALAAS